MGLCHLLDTDCLAGNSDSRKSANCESLIHRRDGRGVALDNRYRKRPMISYGACGKQKFDSSKESLLPEIQQRQTS